MRGPLSKAAKKLARLKRPAAEAAHMVSTKGEEKNRYKAIIAHIFVQRFRKGAAEVPFLREDITSAAEELGLEQVKNLGDLLYSFRHRGELPDAIRKTAPPGREWMIVSTGRSAYSFVTAPKGQATITPNPQLAHTKVPDSTPGVIEKYALNDEQALLAKVRYNRLIDIFTGVACYSLQSHLRTTVPKMGQVETDEVYVGVDRRGAHYVFPVQAKGGKDRLGAVQIHQDIALCQHKFPDLICRPIGAQFTGDDVIALMELALGEQGEVVIADERHYRLVPPEDVTPEDLEKYGRT